MKSEMTPQEGSREDKFSWLAVLPPSDLMPGHSLAELSWKESSGAQTGQTPDSESEIETARERIWRAKERISFSSI